jgi:hypothetical protein
VDFRAEGSRRAFACHLLVLRELESSEVVFAVVLGDGGVGGEALGGALESDGGVDGGFELGGAGGRGGGELAEGEHSEELVGVFDSLPALAFGEGEVDQLEGFEQELAQAGAGGFVEFGVAAIELGNEVGVSGFPAVEGGAVEAEDGGDGGGGVSDEEEGEGGELLGGEGEGGWMLSARSIR